MDLSEIRNEYRRAGLERDQLDENPFRQFETWFSQATDAQIPEPSAMTLATAAGNGRPSARTVLLKLFDTDGFVFFTNYGSRKASELDENPQAALLFFWQPLERQVRIEGTTARLSAAASLRYFATRPRGSQLGAWCSPQSTVITTRQVLEAKYAELSQKFAAGKVPLPSFWGGYRVIPDRFEFWQGRENRLHDRFQYLRNPTGQWTISRLAP